MTPAPLPVPVTAPVTAPFTFEIRETLSRRITVQAGCMEEAWDEVDRMYMESEIVLDESDFGARLAETQAMSTAQRDVR